MTEREQLLDDVLAEPITALTGAADNVLARTLLEVRCHRARRRRRWVASSAGGALVVAALTLYQLRTSLPLLGPRSKPNPAQILYSRPLPASAWLRTTSEGTRVIHSSAEGLQTVSNARFAEAPRVVTDDELLKLAQAEPAALIRRADGRSELILLAGSYPKTARGVYH